MTRAELESLCQSAIEAGQDTISLRIYGSPDCKRMRLIGHHRGPYGRVSDWIGNDVRVDFDARTIADYLDTLPISVLSGGDEITATEWGAKP